MKKVILLSGKLQNGKNQFAKYIIDELKNKSKIKVSTDLFARALKDGCKEDFRNLSKVLNNISEEIKTVSKILFDAEHKTHNAQNTILKKIEQIADKLKINDNAWYENKTDITRTILQLVGTEIFRKRVDNDWWPKQTLKRVLASSSDYILITDCRFPNEITVFTDYMLEHEDIDVIAVRINRKNINTDKNTISSHASETALDDWKEWNYIIENNGTLEDLKKSAKHFVSDVCNKPEYKEMLLIRQGVL